MPGPEIDVGPFERERFALAESKCHRRRVKGLKPIRRHGL